MIHKLSWFLDRISKPVYRDTGTGVIKLTVKDRAHAEYLFKLQKLENHEYFDKGDKESDSRGIS